MASTFLKAEWRKLAMANYVIDKSILGDYLPRGTELDLWNGNCYVSLVGFMFLNTRMNGIRIPFHTDFEEVNLRFYVRYHDQGTWKRGVVFISEIVPKPALSLVANLLYGEHYETMRMRHQWASGGPSNTVEYQWKKKKWNTFSVTTNPAPQPIAQGSEAEFITEHYWGYTRIAAAKTSEYEVAHPRWEVYETKAFDIDVDFENVYGRNFTFLQHEKPQSVFVAEGSEIAVMKGRLI